MLNLSRLAVAFSVAFSISGVSNAHDFSQANDLFSKRQLGFQTATKARVLYERSLKERLSENDKVFAVSQIARLDIFRGGMINGVKDAVRKDVFEKCIDTVSSIKNTNRQEYHYFYLSCVAFRGKLSSSLPGRLKWALKMRSAQGAALESTKSQGEYVGGFEGGGVLRVMSAVRGNRKAKPVGLYDPSEALRFSERALQSQSRVYRPFPEPLSGSDFHENNYYVGQAKVALGIENNDLNIVIEGKQIIENSIETLDELEELDELPRGREPETNYYKGLMQELLGKIQKCEKNHKWKSCLVNALD